jgi:polyisoprenoid-binding protein YceI
MKNVKLGLAVFFIFVIGLSLIAAERTHLSSANGDLLIFSEPAQASTRDTRAPSRSRATERYVIDASQSKFMAHAIRGGLLWFKGHDHLIAIRDFNGEATLTPDSISPASLKITARAASMIETSSEFTEPQKQIINKELREIVLLPDTYPDIVFQSAAVTGKASGANQYDLKLTGPLTLHGITKTITIPTRVVVSGNELRANGEFSISRDDFNVKATSAFHGLVRVKDSVKFTFDIVAHQAP